MSGKLQSGQFSTGDDSNVELPSEASTYPPHPTQNEVCQVQVTSLPASWVQCVNHRRDKWAVLSFTIHTCLNTDESHSKLIFCIRQKAVDTCKSVKKKTHQLELSINTITILLYSTQRRAETKDFDPIHILVNDHPN